MSIAQLRASISSCYSSTRIMHADLFMSSYICVLDFGFKELIQNAEDAGAKEVRFLFDKNTYGQDSRLLHHPDLAAFQVNRLLHISFIAIYTAQEEFINVVEMRTFQTNGLFFSLLFS